MRILVLSDSHGSKFNTLLALEQQPEAKYVFHLGDGEHDLSDIKDRYANKIFVQVKGNCDFYSSLPENETLTVGGKKIFLTHGYKEQVKFGYTTLYYKAKELSADIALFGHTHTPFSDYYDGMYIFNPGSLHDGRYGIIDITDAGIVCIHNKVRYE